MFQKCAMFILLFYTISLSQLFYFDFQITPDTKSNTDVPASTNEDGHGKGWSAIKGGLIVLSLTFIKVVKIV